MGLAWFLRMRDGSTGFMRASAASSSLVQPAYAMTGRFQTISPQQAQASVSVFLRIPLKCLPQVMHA